MSEAEENESEWWQRVLRFGVLPFLGYLGCFFVLTYPLGLFFFQKYFCDLGDGLQMIWDMWWVRHALMDLHQLPWQTTLLYYPQGTTLLLHSVSPLNGIISIPLAQFFSPIVTYNVILTLAFVLSGLTAFWLAHAMTGAYWPSLAAGYVFTFSEIHYAHSAGHLGPISMQVLPLFLLVWLRLLVRPGIVRAIAAAGMLFLVLLTDQYLFLFSVLAAIVGVVWQLVRCRGLGEWKSREGMLAAGCFLVVSGLTTGVLVLAMSRAAGAQPFVGMHTNPAWYSADLVGMFVPGSTWQYRSLTQSIWPPLGEPAEKNTSLSLAMLVAAVCGSMRGGRAGIKAAGFWITTAITFALLALGPTLQFRGIALTDWMPYRLLGNIFPLLRFSGCPLCMLMMAQLACAVLAAAGLKRLGSVSKRKRTVLAILFVMAMVVQSQPSVLISVDPVVPHWVEFVRNDPTPGAVLDAVDGDESSGLYEQTIHQRPIGGGQLSRAPIPARMEWEGQLDALRRGDVSAVRAFRFIVVRANDPALALPVVFEDRSVRVYRVP